MSRREFSPKIRAQAFQRAAGHCEMCSAFLMAGRFHYDHIVPDAIGGEPTLDNCRVVCLACHGEKTSKDDVPRIAKMKRQRDKHIDAFQKSRRPVPGSKASGWKKPFNRPAERRV